MIGRIKDKKTIDDYHKASLNGFNPGDPVTIRIQEYTVENPNRLWYLINTKSNPSTSLYSSEEPLRRGEVVRLYRDPTLGNYANGGNFAWVDSNYVEVILDTNISAKYLLSGSESGLEEG